VGKKVLLFGHTGKLGSAILQALNSVYSVACVNSENLDVCSQQAVEELLIQTRPDIVINCIARTSIDDCEKNPSFAARVNSLFPEQLAKASQTLDFKLVHFSTESVLAEGSHLTRDESSPIGPSNQYGFTKYAAELAIQAFAENYLILRLPLLFGPGGKGTQLLETMITRGRQGDKNIWLAEDVIVSPTYNLDVAAMTKSLLQHDEVTGLFHLCNSGRATLFALVEEAFRHLEINTPLRKGKGADLRSAVKRNSQMPIDQGKLPTMRHWREALEDYCNSLS